MTCKFIVALALASGCGEEVPTFATTATAQMPTELSPPDDGIPADFGHYRWELVETPRGASLGDLSAETPSIAITPPGRGIYVLDRWFVGEAAEQLSYHVVVTVDGIAPDAAVAGPSVIDIAVPATLDGSTSSSPEDLVLTFQWRLAARPPTSTLELVDAGSATLTITADVAGSYAIELRVFDGELWSAPATTTLVAH